MAVINRYTHILIPFLFINLQKKENSVEKFTNPNYPEISRARKIRYLKFPFAEISRYT